MLQRIDKKNGRMAWKTCYHDSLGIRASFWQAFLFTIKCGVSLPVRLRLVIWCSVVTIFMTLKINDCTNVTVKYNSPSIQWPSIRLLISEKVKIQVFSQKGPKCSEVQMNIENNRNSAKDEMTRDKKWRASINSENAAAVLMNKYIPGNLIRFRQKLGLSQQCWRTRKEASSTHFDQVNTRLPRFWHFLLSK